MKTNLFILVILSCLNLTFGQATSNQSITQVLPAITNPISGFNGEIFRFRSGIVTQFDDGNNFDLSPTSPLNSRWFSLGNIRTSAPTVTPARNAYGLRFQAGAKALTFGYQNVNDPLNINPRIEWIGTGAALGNLEFRVANSFTSTVSTLVATMLNNGSTVFGTQILNPNNAKVVVQAGQDAGFNIESSSVRSSLNINQLSPGTSNTVCANINSRSSSSSTDNSGLNVRTEGGGGAIGITSATFNVVNRSLAIFGRTQGTAQAEYAIYGSTPIGTNRFAGYFDGNVFYSGALTPSDKKLKNKINQETSVLEKIDKLNPVTYEYKEITEMNLPNGNQHGFISQELATVFPELTEDISKPIFDKEQKIIGNFDFKAVNYNGLISILTAGIKELNIELKTIKEEFAILKNAKNSLSNLSENNNKAFMEQNIPNPFTDQTIIRYQLPVGVNNAIIMVMDLNGKLIKNYAVNNNQSEIVIKASEIGKGFFIYSLVQNGQELVTKKMIIN